MSHHEECGATVVVDDITWKKTCNDEEWVPLRADGEEDYGVEVAPLWPDGIRADAEQLEDGSWRQIEPRAWLISFGVYYPGSYDTPPEWDTVEWQERPTREQAMHDGWIEYQRREREAREAEEAYMASLREWDERTERDRQADAAGAVVSEGG